MLWQRLASCSQVACSGGVFRESNARLSNCCFWKAIEENDYEYNGME